MYFDNKMSCSTDDDAEIRDCDEEAVVEELCDGHYLQYLVVLINNKKIDALPLYSVSIQGHTYELREGAEMTAASAD